MAARILDGKAVAEEIRAEVAPTVAAFAAKAGRPPGLGIVLVGVALFLAVEVSSLLLGEAAPPEITEATIAAARKYREIDKVLNVVTMQQGPGEVLVHIKVAFQPRLTIEDVCRVINEFERTLRDSRSEVRWVFVEPDIEKTESQRAVKRDAVAAGGR